MGEVFRRACFYVVGTYNVNEFGSACRGTVRVYALVLEMMSVDVCTCLRVKAEPLEFEGEGSEGSDHSDSADEADPPRPLCRVETGGDIGLIKGDVDIELMFAKTMSDIPDLKRFKRNVLKDILTAVQYKRTEFVFVYTLWDLLPVENDNQTSLANHVVARVRILENSLRLNSIPEGQKNWIRSAPGTATLV